jgi:hypothetical protein
LEQPGTLKQSRFRFFHPNDDGVGMHIERTPEWSLKEKKTTRKVIYSMVFYYLSKHASEGSNSKFILYESHTSLENKILLDYGFLEDLCLVSSASKQIVFIRCPQGSKISALNQLPPIVLNDACQLLLRCINAVNPSRNYLNGVCSPWENLTFNSEGTDLGFIDWRLVWQFSLPKSDQSVLKRLDATRIEKESISVKENKSKYKLKFARAFSLPTVLQLAWDTDSSCKIASSRNEKHPSTRKSSSFLHYDFYFFSCELLTYLCAFSQKKSFFRVKCRDFLLK